ncbi:MAG: response regulator [Actinobacteria bacterium]|jgi:two-component system response regulator RegX3|uniref:Sensory transduction protein RegX3 n=1 Tax=freshwater metagenome TaxID=449393 RepID=A0A6J7D929_9ZZZZ|nr:response regulator [Actinomycetota bacterium]
MSSVLVVEDEQSLREPLVYILQREGFDVLEAVDGPSALLQWQNNSPDLILLDLMLPGMSGVDVCREIRTQSNVPIIMVTAKDSEVDKVVGLEIGADDYVVKPYSTRELLARIKAVLRRGAVQDSTESRSVLEAGPVRLDTERHAVTVNGQPVTLPLKEFELLEYLMDNTNRVLTRGQIIDRVWGSNYYGDTKTLDVHVKRIRSKIEPDPANPQFIMTVRGLGYKFET